MNFFNVYFVFERERERESERAEKRTERERETELKQAPDSELSAQSSTRAPNL